MKGESRKVFWKPEFRIIIEHVAKEINFEDFCPKVYSLKKGSGCLNYDPDTTTILADMSPHVVSIAYGQDKLIWQGRYYGYMIQRTQRYVFTPAGFRVIIITLKNTNLTETYEKYCPRVFDMSVLEGEPDIPKKVLIEAKEIYQKNLEVPLLSVYGSDRKRYLFISPKQNRIVEEYDSCKIIFKRRFD